MSLVNSGISESCKLREVLGAWFVLSGKKHDRFEGTDELVAIIYDGTYHTFEGNKFAAET